MSIEDDQSQYQNCSPVLKGIRVLLVEDEPDIAELFVFILQDLGADVILVDSAWKALEILEQKHPDILVSNLKLPDADGRWLIQQVRSLGKSWQRQIPAIAVTSYTREANRQSSIEAGFHWFMPKPLDPDELVTEILELTGRKQ